MQDFNNARPPQSAKKSIYIFLPIVEKHSAGIVNFIRQGLLCVNQMFTISPSYIKNYNKKEIKRK